MPQSTVRRRTGAHTPDRGTPRWRAHRGRRSRRQVLHLGPVKALRRGTTRWVASALALVAAAVLLRLIGLHERPLFRDEAASWLEARYALPDLLDHAAGEPYPPLYALLMHGWIRLFGDSEAVLRLPSVLAGTAMVLVGWRWAHEALGRWSGLVALGLLTFSPLAISNARDARMYALEALFATVAWWFIWRLTSGRASGGSRGSTWLHGVVLAVAVAGELWTLSLGLVVAGMQGLLVLVAVLAARRSGSPSPGRGGPAGALPLRRGGRSGSGPSGETVALWGIVAGGLSFLPWLPSTLAAATNGDPFWTPTPGFFDWILTWQVALVGWDGHTIANLAAAPLLLLALAGLVGLLRSSDPPRRWSGRVLLAGIALVPAIWAVSQVRSIYDHRYFGAAVAPLALAVAAGVTLVAGRLPRWTGRQRHARRAEPTTVLVAAALTCLLTGPFALEWLSDWRSPDSGSPVRDLVRVIAPRVRPGDTLLAIDARAYFPLAYEVQRAAPDLRGVSVPVLDWVSGVEERYNGASLIDDAVKVDDAALQRLGARQALRLGPGGRVWLIASSDDAGGALDTSVLRLPGAVRQDRLVLGADRYEPAQALLIELGP